MAFYLRFFCQRKCHTLLSSSDSQVLVTQTQNCTPFLPYFDVCVLFSPLDVCIFIQIGFFLAVLSEEMCQVEKKPWNTFCNISPPCILCTHSVVRIISVLYICLHKMCFSAKRSTHPAILLNTLFLRNDNNKTKTKTNKLFFCRLAERKYIIV